MSSYNYHIITKIMSPVRKPTCILSCPLVEKFMKTGCTTFTTFTASNSESFNTKFDGHNLDHIVNVHDCSNEGDDPDYLISITFSISPSFSWTISDIREPRYGFVKMFEHLENNQHSTVRIGGGCNSTWCFHRENADYKLYFDITGAGGDATVDLAIPRRQGDECVRIMKKVYQAVESQ